MASRWRGLSLDGENPAVTCGLEDMGADFTARAGDLLEQGLRNIFSSANERLAW
jgi:hypothetical protein